MMKPLQKHNTKVRVIIVLLIVALLGVIFGSILWSRNDDQQNQTISTETEVPAQVNVENKKSEETEVENETVVDDWGVGFEHVDGLHSTGVTSEFRSGGENASDHYIFTTDRIRELGGRCVGRPFGDTVILTRYQEKPVTVPDGQLINEDALQGYYYVASSPIVSCSGVDENGAVRAPSQVETDDRAALKQSISELKVVE
ncbi:MAG: hypothetical protein EON54_28920 [Alcaligenaceae bacterium]|nr:MAG: hypothetical protein EON54_28920 [Alcaligenaceae bacterium]